MWHQLNKKLCQQNNFNGNIYIFEGFTTAVLYIHQKSETHTAKLVKTKQRNK